LEIAGVQPQMPATSLIASRCSRFRLSLLMTRYPRERLPLASPPSSTPRSASSLVASSELVGAPLSLPLAA
jgi:hypothetical protein